MKGVLKTTPLPHPPRGIPTQSRAFLLNLCEATSSYERNSTQRP